MSLLFLHKVSTGQFLKEKEGEGRGGKGSGEGREEKRQFLGDGVGGGSRGFPTFGI